MGYVGKTVAFDFDGVVAKYDGWKGIHHFGEPNEEVVEAIRHLKRLGFKIILYSTRGGAEMQRYCEKHDIPVDYYNVNPEVISQNPGKPVAHVYVDDRAINYHGQKAPELIREIVALTINVNNKENSLREKLAEIEHNQWVSWSKAIAEKENLSPERIERWKKLWVPYGELPEEAKELDREWADKAIGVIKEGCPRCRER